MSGQPYNAEHRAMNAAIYELIDAMRPETMILLTHKQLPEGTTVTRLLSNIRARGSIAQVRLIAVKSGILVVRTW